MTGLTNEQLEQARCPDSPTGAHHWLLEGNAGEKVLLGVCKHCKARREFSGDWHYPVNPRGRTEGRTSLIPQGQPRDLSPYW